MSDLKTKNFPEVWESFETIHSSLPFWVGIGTRPERVAEASPGPSLSLS